MIWLCIGFGLVGLILLRRYMLLAMLSLFFCFIAGSCPSGSTPSVPVGPAADDGAGDHRAGSYSVAHHS